MFDNLKDVVSFLKQEIKWEELDPQLQKQWTYISEMHSLILQYHRRSVVIKMFGSLHPELSQASLYRYYDKTQYVLGTTHFVDRNYSDLYIEDTLGHGIELAKEREDLKALAKFTELMMIHRKEQAERASIMRKFEQHTYLMTIDPRHLGFTPEPLHKIEEMIDGFNFEKSLTEQLKIKAKSVPFTEILEDEDTNN